ncbi:MAG: hypothetical protein ACYTHJ_20170 [Planctomycetota bacterium]|jgi:hypothetical protein
MNFHLSRGVVAAAAIVSPFAAIHAQIPTHVEQFLAEPGMTAANTGCLSCHGGIENATENMGFELSCVFCHGGDPFATVKEEAHVLPVLPIIMDNTVPPLDYDLPYRRFLNPADLRVVHQTCALCHAHRVQETIKGLMATAAGHYAGGLYQNGVVDTKTPIYGTFATVDEDGDVPMEAGAVEDLIDLIVYDPNADPTQVATHYAAVPGQSCARCHLWSRGKGYRGAIGAEGVYRADGCIACHMPYHDDGLSRSDDVTIDHEEPGHPISHTITREIPDFQCLHCHHRGARIGLSYTGRAQMPPDLPSGPGVPGTTDVKFNGNFHMVDQDAIPPDIHAQLGMACVDCHLRADVMGDGNIYGHMDQATKVECRTCHGTHGEPGTLINNDGASHEHIHVGPTGLAILISKVDNSLHLVRQVRDIVDPGSGDYNARGACAMNDDHLQGEGGLECAACHASWTPNCFGCHFERNEQLVGLNLVTRQEEIGKTSTNNKIFETFKHFYLGPNAQGRISPYIVGCQAIADVTAPDGSKILDFVMPETVNGKSGLGINPVNPHTIRGRNEVRTCVECHRAPPALGLGTGNFAIARDLLFLAGPDGIDVMDRKTDPTAPTVLGTLAAEYPRALASITDIIQGTTDYLYVASGAAGVHVFDLRDTISCDPVHAIDGLYALDVSIAAKHAYVTVAGAGVQVYDIEQPTAPAYVTTIAVPGAVKSVPWGIHLFVAAGLDGLFVVDVADHQHPGVAAHVPGINALDVALYAHFQEGRDFAARAYVADPSYGVRVVDLLPDFSKPVLVGGMPLPGASALDTYTRYVPADDQRPSREHDYLYVAAGSAGMHVLDMTDPDAIKAVASMADLGGAAIDVDVVSQLAPPGVDDYAIIANNQLGLQVVDVTEPWNPLLVLTAGGTAGSRVLVEVQALDRFMDEQGRLLKENSHPGAGSLSRADIVSILSAPVISPGCEIPDLDGDTDADLKDLRRLITCTDGPSSPVAPGCTYADYDDDGHVGLQDFAHFQTGYAP